MKSFPSTFTINPLVQSGTLSVNLKQTLVNIGENIMHNSMQNGTDSGLSKAELGEYLDKRNFDFNEHISLAMTANAENANLPYNPSVTLNNISTPISSQYDELFGNNYSGFENPFKIPVEVLKSINSYRAIKKAGAIERRKVTINDDTGGGNQAGEEIAVEAISLSLFNPWFGVRAQGFMKYIPKLYTDRKDNKTYEAEGAGGGGDSIPNIMQSGNSSEQDSQDTSTNVKFSLSSNTCPDFTDCSIKTLVALSGGHGSDEVDWTKKRSPMKLLGRGTFRYVDFMFCRDVGKISNNHLIVLRRFTHPVGDNIFNAFYNPEVELPDRGHLVTWFGNDENKLEDICKYTMNTTWKELNSKIQDVDSKEDDNHIGSSLINLMNPNYVSGVMKGHWGGNNMALNWAAGKLNLQAKGSYEGDSALYYRDQNRVWEPKNTIQSTHVYEGKIQFSHEFSLTFTYEIRHYDGINGKTAFLDLMGNVLKVCHNTGRFWGGSIRFLGAPRNSAGWKKMNALLDAFQSGSMNVIDGLFNCQNMSELGSWITDFVGNAFEQAKSYIQSAGEYIKNNPEEIKEKAKSGAKTAVNIGMGMLRNKLGRPAIYAMDSLLNGNYVGMWHVTIGNPRNPMFSIGNLMLMDTEITHYGPLGLDDFPTKLKVVCKLKHGRPRDATEIASMYTMGQGGLLLSLNAKQIREYINTYDTKQIANLGFGYEALDPTENKDGVRSIVESDKLNSIWANMSN